MYSPKTAQEIRRHYRIDKNLYLPQRLHKKAKGLVNSYVSDVEDIMSFTDRIVFNKTVKAWKTEYRGRSLPWQYAFHHMSTGIENPMRIDYNRLVTEAHHKQHIQLMCLSSYSFRHWMLGQQAFRRHSRDFNTEEIDILENVLPVLYSGIDILKKERLFPSYSASALLQRYMTAEQVEWIHNDYR